MVARCDGCGRTHPYTEFKESGFLITAPAITMNYDEAIKWLEETLAEAKEHQKIIDAKSD